MITNSVPRDSGGRVAQVHDGLNGISTSLKYVNYQLDTAGPGHEPHPWLWTASTGHLRSVVTKEAELVGHLATAIERWIKANPDADPPNVAAMRQAVKHYRSIARSLLTCARNARNAQANLDVTNT
ncbi:hypothetical protein ACQPYA_17510 [Micromonospora sp. CA-263727]|uniref:hypothetical protein n=1 Tax=Micromonospora sp. CA-263727 TaxID=3239967 RepID=UPI003D94DB7B